MKMKRMTKHFLTATAIALAGGVSVFAQTNAPVRIDFSSFKIVPDRNIFNPNRTSRRATTAEVRKAPMIESFALAGTMSYEQGDFAFFDGTSPQFRKSAKPGDSIAGYKVLEITPKGVKLATATNQIEMSVGMQFRREDEGEWILSAQSGTFASGVNGSSARTTPSPGTSDTESTSGAPTEAAPGSSGGEDEVLKKLMQKREKELNNP